MVLVLFNDYKYECFEDIYTITNKLIRGEDLQNCRLVESEFPLMNLFLYDFIVSVYYYETRRIITIETAQDPYFSISVKIDTNLNKVELDRLLDEGIGAELAGLIEDYFLSTNQYEMEVIQ